MPAMLSLRHAEEHRAHGALLQSEVRRREGWASGRAPLPRMHQHASVGAATPAKRPRRLL